jgi:ArsR family transcriptional regulator
MATAAKLDLVRAARLFHALSDPTRLRLLLLLRRGERCVCDLMDGADAGQSRVSFHLKVLKEAGIIVDRRDGRWVHYHVHPEVLSELAGVLDAVEPTGGAVAQCCR